MDLPVIILTLNLLITFYLLHSLRKQKLKTRVIESFVSGIIRSVSDYHNHLTEHEDFKLKFKSTKLPISYDNLLENICLEFDKDYVHNNEYIKNFILNEKLLFLGKEKSYNIKIIQKYFEYFGEPFSNNRGFFQIYLDFYDKYGNTWIDEDLKKKIIKEYEQQEKK